MSSPDLPHLPPAAHDDAVGRVVLGRFRIVRRLALGGMGSIYLARTEGADGFVRPVVVKRILPHLVGDEEIRTMFSREARILARLRHPGIVGIQEFALEGDAYVMVLDYVHGYTFAKWIRFHRDLHGPVPADVAVHVVVRVLDALHHAHRLPDATGRPLGIVHRDVTPSNVLLDVAGDVKLADFGIARTAAEATQASSDSVAIKGKFSYLAPELFDGAPPSPATDTYSTAVVLHQALTGRNEFRADEPRQVVGRVIQHVPTRVDAVRDDVSPALADVVARALEKDPARRFPSADALAAALRGTGLPSTDTLAARLGALLARDFRDPRMPRHLGLPPLDVLEEAWNAPVARPATPPSEPSPSAPTRVEGTRARPGPGGPLAAPATPPTESGAPPVRRQGAWIVAGLALTGLALGGAWLATRPPPAPAPVLVVSAAEASAANGPAEPVPGTREDPGTAPSPTAGAAPPAPAPAAADEAPEPPAARRAPTPEQRITRAFNRQRPALERCMNAHAEAIDGAPRLSVRLDVGPDGRVRRAEILPPEVGRSALGRCLARASREARFDAADGDVTVRIPLRLSRGTGR